VTLGILGKKVGMTQIFDIKGNVIPVTLIQAGPCQVTQLKTKETCGYSAIQLGYSTVENAQKHLTKAQRGHLEKNQLPFFRFLKEYRISSRILSQPEETNLNYQIGNSLDVSFFEIGEKVNVTGITIGKGNTGNVKLHHFHRGAMTHGSKHHRLQGSMGAGTSPGRVFPGKRMPRRSGFEQRTIQNLEILDLFVQEHLLVVKGSIPGKAGNLVNIQKRKN
jgi:large subunit ribosomal protein L3